ncbi:MAG TPA: hypothetical protein VM686_38280 [Polyangiaceae bacterium]|jgi:hypothetical protein|nr:hypothetical protein [Polyangiaceae bacterium]
MSDSLAIVAEPSGALREHMVRTLALAGYQARSTPDALQLNVALHSTAAFTVRTLLLLLDPNLLSECGRALTKLQRGRSSAGFCPPWIIQTRASDRPVSVASVGFRNSPLYVLGAPFESLELERLARHYRSTARRRISIE